MEYGFEIELSECTECRRCTAACALVQEGKVRFQSSRITVISAWPENPEIRVCRFDDCPDHPCIAACPVDAISENGGRVIIDEEECIGCEACVTECPFQAITFYNDKAWKCDFCGGDPACVKECVTEAIRKKGVS